MATKRVLCPICNDWSDRSLEGIDLEFFECDTCGRYAIAYNYLHKIDKDKFRSYLYYNVNIFQTINTREKLFYYIGTDIGFKKIYYTHDNARHLKIEDVENWYPKTFSEKIDRILLGLAQFTEYTGKSIFLIDELKKGLFFINLHNDDKIYPKENIDEQIDYFTTYMVTQDLIKIEVSSVSILPNGLSRVDDLQKNQSKSKQVFVAMEFSDDTTELREALRDGIKRAGYIAQFIDEKHHNKQIVPEMLYQIRQSKFVVAEFSDFNNGAYYEAGYAAGLGKEVIHVCQKKKFGKKGHFDIKQKSSVLYETLEELPEILKKRIEATII